MAVRVAVTAILAIFAVYPAKAGHHPLSSVVSAFRRIDVEQVFRACVDLTTFGVTVTDRKGNLVTDLDKEDFAILEDGKPQTIQQFARGDGDTSPEMRSEERRVGKDGRGRRAR